MTDIPEDIAWVAERYTLKPRSGEPEESFRQRLANIVLEEGNDPYMVVSILTGKDIDFVSENFMGDVYTVRQLMSAKQQALMMEVSDTYYNIPHADFIPIVERAGFEQVHHHVYKTSYERQHQFAIWAKHESGFLLASHSYIGLENEILDGAYLHYELNATMPFEDMNEKEHRNYLKGIKGSNGTPRSNNDCNTLLCAVDVRERFLGKLYEIEHCGFPTNNPWQYFGDHYVQFLDSEECRGEANDEDARTKERIISLPDKTKIMLGIEELCN